METGRRGNSPQTIGSNSIGGGKVKIILDEKDEMEIILEGETHTLCNALRKILLEDETVKAVAYSIDHPIIGEPHMYIRGDNPRKSLKKAAKTLKERSKEFKDLIERSSP